MLDAIARAVLARGTVVEYLRHDPAPNPQRAIDDPVAPFARDDDNLRPLAARGIIVDQRGRFRVRQRRALHGCARSIARLATTAGVTG